MDTHDDVLRGYAEPEGLWGCRTRKGKRKKKEKRSALCRTTRTGM